MCWLAHNNLSSYILQEIENIILIHVYVEKDNSYDLGKLKTVNETHKIFHCCKIANLEISLPAFSFSTLCWRFTPVFPAPVPPLMYKKTIKINASMA